MCLAKENYFTQKVIPASQGPCLYISRVFLAKLKGEVDSPASVFAVKYHKKPSRATMSLQLLVAVVGTSGEFLSGHLEREQIARWDAHSLSPSTTSGQHLDLVGKVNRSFKDAAFCLSQNNFLLIIW